MYVWWDYLGWDWVVYVLFKWIVKYKFGWIYVCGLKEKELFIYIDDVSLGKIMGKGIGREVGNGREIVEARKIFIWKRRGRVLLIEEIVRDIEVRDFN